MIHAVDSALKELIRQDALDISADVDVVLDAPTREWASRRKAPTINLYLYDIREDLRRRERGLINEYDAQRSRAGRPKIVARHLPPRWFKLSYMVTAWTQRPEDEHRLLSQMLACFLHQDAIPADLLDEETRAIGLPFDLAIALPPPEDRSFADVWSALGGELRPSLDVVVTAPTDTGQRYETAERPDGARLDIGGMGDWPPREERAGRRRA